MTKQTDPKITPIADLKTMALTMRAALIEQLNAIKEKANPLLSEISEVEKALTAKRTELDTLRVEINEASETYLDQIRATFAMTPGEEIPEEYQKKAPPAPVVRRHAGGGGGRVASYWPIVEKVLRENDKPEGIHWTQLAELAKAAGAQFTFGNPESFYTQLTKKKDTLVDMVGDGKFRLIAALLTKAPAAPSVNEAPPVVPSDDAAASEQDKLGAAANQ